MQSDCVFYIFLFNIKYATHVNGAFADSQDVDLDAILGELCALERRCDGDIAATPAPDSQRPGRPTSARINPGDNTDIKNEGGTRLNKKKIFLRRISHYIYCN